MKKYIFIDCDQQMNYTGTLEEISVELNDSEFSDVTINSENYELMEINENLTIKRGLYFWDYFSLNIKPNISSALIV